MLPGKFHPHRILLLVLGIQILPGFWLEPVQAEELACKRPELVWETWRDHVIANNPETTAQFELGGNSRDELVRAYGCDKPSEKCPPDKVAIFHCTGNKSVLFAFIKKGCVTIAHDISVEKFHQIVTGGPSC